KCVGGLLVDDEQRQCSKWLYTSICALVSERLVDLGYDRGSFADSRCHALRRSRTDVTNCEDSRLTCLEFKWCSPDVEARPELLAGRHKPSLIDIDAAPEPSGVGIGADKEKNLAQPTFDAYAVRPVSECRTDHAAGLLV